MKNNQIKILVKSVIVVNIVLLLVGSIVLFILGKYSWLIGYMLGSITADITFIMHANTVRKIGIVNTSAAKSSISSAVFRTLISAASLGIAFLLEWIDIFATFIGLVVIKLVIIIVSFVVEKRYNEENKGGDSLE